MIDQWIVGYRYFETNPSGTCLAACSTCDSRNGLITTKRCCLEKMFKRVLLEVKQFLQNCLSENHGEAAISST